MGEMLSEDIRAEPLGLTTNFLVTEAHRFELLDGMDKRVR